MEFEPRLRRTDDRNEIDDQTGELREIVDLNVTVGQLVDVDRIGLAVANCADRFLE